MAVGVIAQLEAIVKPHAEGLDAFVDFAELVKLSFVDESNHRYFWSRSVVSSFVVISVIVAADMVLADPAGRSSMVIATSRASWSAAFEMTGIAIEKGCKRSGN